MREASGGTAADGAPEGEPGRTLWDRLALAALALSALLLVHGAWRVGPTYDEHFYAAAGYAYWRTGSFGLNREHPPLLKLLAGAPLVAAGDLVEPPDWSRSPNAPASFFYQRNREDWRRNLFLARLPLCALAVACGALVWRVARGLFGARAGFVAATLFALNPNVLAHGRLAALDLGTAATMFAATVVFLAALERPSAPRTLLAGALFGVANLSKLTALLLGPLFGGLALVAAARARSARPLGRVALVLLVGLAVFAAGYGFEAKSLHAARGSPHYRTEPYWVSGEPLDADAWARELEDVGLAPATARFLASAPGIGASIDATALFATSDDDATARAALRALGAVEGASDEQRERAFRGAFFGPALERSEARRERVLAALDEAAGASGLGAVPPDGDGGELAPDAWSRFAANAEAHGAGGALARWLGAAPGERELRAALWLALHHPDDGLWRAALRACADAERTLAGLAAAVASDVRAGAPAGFATGAPRPSAARDDALARIAGVRCASDAGWRRLWTEAHGRPWPRPILTRGWLDALARGLFGAERPIPLLTALKGLDFQLAHAEVGHASTFRGRTVLPGADFAEGNPFPEYYAVVLGVKNPLAFLLLAAGGVVLGLRPRPGWTLLRALGYLGFAVLLLGVFSTGSVLSGVKYLLPVLPFLAVLAGRCALAFPRAAPALAIVAVAESIWIHPHELMYYNALAGGSEGGPAITVVGDDWGQDVPAMGRFYAEHAEEIEAAGGLWYEPYSAAPKSTFGLARARALPVEGGPVEGIVAVHAIDYERESERFAWLAEYAPFVRIGWSILVYDTRGGPPGRDPREEWTR